MPLTPHPGDNIDILLVNQALAALAGTGCLSGGEVSLIDGSEPIRLSVDSASIRVGGSDSISVGATEIEVPDSDPSWPRRDVVYADAQGEVQIRRGQPRPQKGADVLDPDRNDRPTQLDQPTPPNVIALGGVPLAEVFVPPRASSAADLDQLGERAVTDRRQSSYTADSIAGNHSALSNLTADDHPQYVPTDGSRAAEPNIIGGGTEGQVLTSNGTRTEFAHPLATESFSQTELSPAGTENDSHGHDFTCPHGVELVAIGVVDVEGMAQTAVEATVNVDASPADAHTTTSTHESLSETFNSNTNLSFSIRNTGAQTVVVSAKLWFRPHLA